MQDKINPIIPVNNLRTEGIPLYPNEIFIPANMYIFRHRAPLKPYYWVSNYGRVVSMYDNICRLIEPSISKAGRAHFTAQLQDNSDANVLVYRLELASFTPCYDIYVMQVDHIDDNPNNNMLSNLQWLTPAQNLAKALATGKIRSTDDNTFYNIMMNVYDWKV